MSLDRAHLVARDLVNQGSESVADGLSDWILGKIACGEWSVGYTIPSEQDLIEQFGISRMAVRECILKLRALGILKGSRGRRTQVAKIDTRTLGRLFPLILATEGQQAFEHFFLVRLVLESSSAYRAAQFRTEEESARLIETAEQIAAVPAGETDTLAELDRTLHIQIAEAAQNSLYPILIEALWGFLHQLPPIVHDICVQRQEEDNFRHRAIVEAIKFKNPDRARVEMESHLQASADQVRRGGILEHQGAAQDGNGSGKKPLFSKF